MKHVFFAASFVLSLPFFCALAEAKVLVDCTLHNTTVKLPIGTFNLPLIDGASEAIPINEEVTAVCFYHRKLERGSVQCEFRDQDGSFASSIENFELSEPFQFNLTSRNPSDGQLYTINCASNL